ncbi:hypothetical protein MLD38_038196 [Melastoma candidum]|uniref:Uncharacterized protein n=1 Tax=Melastoma candidum TaxID=119954 RepID=A0ACB9KYU8_9MYRT|nr:hypothetical protein MLD38_038196 [Melastoma candidum]
MLHNGSHFPFILPQLTSKPPPYKHPYSDTRMDLPCRCCHRLRLFPAVLYLIIFHAVLMSSSRVLPRSPFTASVGDSGPTVEEESWAADLQFQPGLVREGIMLNSDHGRTQAWSTRPILLNFLPRGMFSPSGPSKRSDSLND